jgi:hypothetical protein
MHDFEEDVSGRTQFLSSATRARECNARARLRPLGARASRTGEYDDDVSRNVDAGSVVDSLAAVNVPLDAASRERQENAFRRRRDSPIHRHAANNMITLRLRKRH